MRNRTDTLTDASTTTPWRDTARERQQAAAHPVSIPKGANDAPVLALQPAARTRWSARSFSLRCRPAAPSPTSIRRHSGLHGNRPADGSRCRMGWVQSRDTDIPRTRRPQCGNTSASRFRPPIIGSLCRQSILQHPRSKAPTTVSLFTRSNTPRRQISMMGRSSKCG